MASKDTLIGQTLSEALEKKLALQGYRIIKPGYMYDMMFNMGRTNIKVDENNVITDVYNG